MKEFVKRNADKLLMASLFIYMVHVVLALVYWHANAETIAWAREIAAGFQGALLGLVTGVAIGQHLANEANAKANEPKPQG